MGPGKEHEDLRPTEAEVVALETVQEKATRISDNARIHADLRTMRYERAQQIDDRLRLSIESAKLK
jgi:hypothetical protein